MPSMSGVKKSLSPREPKFKERVLVTAKATTQHVKEWFEERLGLESVQEFMSHKTVPVHSSTIWYYFGGITLFLFVIQVLTGVLLLLYYRPTPTEAYESVQFIMTRVQFGWLVRSIHSWSANLMILAAFIHMFSVVFLQAYRRPREVTWLSGSGITWAGSRFRIQWVSVALEHRLLFCHQSRNRHGGERALDWSLTWQDSYGVAMRWEERH